MTTGTIRPSPSAPPFSPAPQFRIAAALEYMAVCGGLAAFAHSAGVVACAFLMGMALSLAAKQGGLALASLLAATLSCELELPAIQSGSGFSRQVIVLLLATAICVWYRLRREFRGGDQGPARNRAIKLD